jgi:hypothetical protein
VRRLFPGVLLALVLPLVPASAADRERWDTRVFAAVQEPGYPAYVFHHRNGRVYAGTYTNPQGDHQRSVVREWSAGGTLLRSWLVPHQNLDEDHGVQVANADARGRLVLLEKSTSSVRTLNVENGNFRRWATLPDLPTCSTGEKPCSPNLIDGPAIPNYATWGPGGALFVSDYGQAVIWRIPARGGTPRIWFASAALDGTGFGTTGLVYEPARRAFLIAQQTTSDLTSNPPVGKLYGLSVDDAGRPGALTTLWRSRIGELPDGFGVARSGRIYVANVGISNQLVELSADGRELDRFPKVPVLGDNGSPVPFDGPSSATFLGTRVLVANQSPLLGTASHHVVLDVEVGEEGAPAHVPRRSRLR